MIPDKPAKQNPYTILLVLAIACGLVACVWAWFPVIQGVMQ